ALAKKLSKVAFADKGAAGAHCTGMYCDAQGLSLQDAAHRYATASTTTFVLGLAAAGTGAFLFVWGGEVHGPAVASPHWDRKPKSLVVGVGVIEAVVR